MLNVWFLVKVTTINSTIKPLTLARLRGVKGSWGFLPPQVDVTRTWASIFYRRYSMPRAFDGGLLSLWVVENFNAKWCRVSAQWIWCWREQILRSFFFVEHVHFPTLKPGKAKRRVRLNYRACHWEWFCAGMRAWFMLRNLRTILSWKHLFASSNSTFDFDLWTFDVWGI